MSDKSQKPVSDEGQTQSEDALKVEGQGQNKDNQDEKVAPEDKAQDKTQAQEKGSQKEPVSDSEEAGEEDKKEKKEEDREDKKEEKKEGDEAKKGDKKEKPASAVKIKRKKKKNLRRQIQKGKVFVKSSYNNTRVMFADLHGNALVWSSSGLLGFKGAKKATTYAATQVVSDVHEKVQKYGLRDVQVFVKGVGAGRDAALRALAQKGYNIIMIKDTTPIPHNGCRAPKPRRV